MHRFLAPGVILAAVVLVAGCATTPPDQDPVQIKLNNLDTRLSRVERVISNQSLVDMSQRLDSLQADVRTLRGRIQELENTNRTLMKQQRDMYTDLDQRIAQLGAGGAGTAGGAAGGGAGGGDAAQAAYTQAFDALKANKYADAVQQFSQFVTTYPNSDLADNAQYWLGETYYVQRDFGKAADAFKKVVQQWPDSRKAPDAMLKLGLSQQQLKQYAQARTTLSQVSQRFPGSQAAQSAAESLKKLPAK